MIKLKDADRGISNFIPRAQRLGRKLGPIKWTYVRLHGPTQFKYQGSYSEAQLSRWAQRIDDWTITTTQPTRSGTR